MVTAPKIGAFTPRLRRLVGIAIALGFTCQSLFEQRTWGKSRISNPNKLYKQQDCRLGA